MNIKSKDGPFVNTDDIESYLVVEDSKDWPHWGWLVFWCVVWWPCAAVWVMIGCNRIKYTVVAYNKDTPHGTTHVFNAEQYGILVKEKGVNK